MNDKLLLEHIERMGITTLKDLAGQMGAPVGLWRKPMVELLQNREVYYCRLIHGKETVLSRHLLFCLRAVYNEPELSEDAQDIYDWISENELAPKKTVFEAVGLYEKEFDLSFEELQKKLCITPLIARRAVGEAEAAEGAELSEEFDFLWITDEHWLRTLHRPPRYKDLAYCVSEIRRLLANRLPTREINNIIYKGVIR